MAGPVLLIPPALAYVWRTRGRREALLCLGAAAAVVAVVVVPFLVLAPHGVWDSIVRQTTRPLQIESLGAALLLAAHHVGGLGLTLDSSRGSQNLIGSLPDGKARTITISGYSKTFNITGWRIDIRSDAVPQTSPDAAHGAVRDR